MEFPLPVALGRRSYYDDDESERSSSTLEPHSQASPEMDPSPETDLTTPQTDHTSSTMDSSHTESLSQLNSDEPVERKAPLQVVDPSSYQIQWTQGRGYGIFATRDIQIGERILAESPILQLATTDLSGIYPAFQALSSEQKSQIHALYWYRSEERRRDHLSFLQPQNSANDLGEAINIEHLSVLAISDSNSFELIPHEPGATAGSGIFLMASRINHSCIPNTVRTFNTALHQLTIHAQRVIPAGAEITISYLPVTFNTAEVRRATLQADYGFVCVCWLCVDQQADLRRKEMCELDGLVDLYLREPGDEKPSGSEKAVEDFQRLVELCTEECWEARGLIRTYNAFARYCVMIGDFKRAVKNAKAMLWYEEISYGADNPRVGRATWLLQHFEAVEWREMKLDPGFLRRT